MLFLYVFSEFFCFVVRDCYYRRFH